MNLLEAMKNRHSVRSYTDKKIEGDVKEQLLSYIKIPLMIFKLINHKGIVFKVI